jgi:hypothetical protein
MAAGIGIKALTNHKPTPNTIITAIRFMRSLFIKILIGKTKLTIDSLRYFKILTMGNMV